MPNINPKRVFSSRTANYIKYHSGYPVKVINTLIKECSLVPNWHVADIGSGTGLLARLFLDFGCTVIGIEPSKEMHLAGDHILANYSGFRSLPGSAEDTDIEDARINLVSAGMVFHWFDAPRARDEFRGNCIEFSRQKFVITPIINIHLYQETQVEYSKSPNW